MMMHVIMTVNGSVQCYTALQHTTLIYHCSQIRILNIMDRARGHRHLKGPLTLPHTVGLSVGGVETQRDDKSLVCVFVAILCLILVMIICLTEWSDFAIKKHNNKNILTFRSY